MNPTTDFDARSNTETKGISVGMLLDLTGERERIRSEYGAGVALLVRRQLMSPDDDVTESVVNEIIDQVILRAAQEDVELPALCRRVTREVCSVKRQQSMNGRDGAPVGSLELTAARAILKGLPERVREALQLWSEGTAEQDICKQLVMTPETLRAWKAHVRRQFEKRDTGISNVITAGWVHRLRFLVFSPQELNPKTSESVSRAE